VAGQTIRALAVVFLLAGCGGAGQQREAAPASAPEDRPVHVEGQDAAARLQKAIAPAIEQARASYPQARDRYLAGLPAGERFFVTCVLRDGRGHFEQVFVLVEGIQGAAISGRIASDILGVEGFQSGQHIELEESEIVDWTISKADGSEEGNFVGKTIDALQAESH
jgi:hypothetical protein